MQENAEFSNFEPGMMFGFAFAAVRAAVSSDSQKASDLPAGKQGVKSGCM